MIKDLATAQEIYSRMNNSSNILLITHKNPDGDGLGTLSALAMYLKSLNKKFQLFCLDEVSKNFSFLPLMHEISNDKELFNKGFLNYITCLL